MVVMRVGHRDAIRVIAVHTDATPVPTGPVVADTPVVRGVGVVAVPARDQRSGRSVVRDPPAVVGVVEHKIAVHVVVPAPRPIHARERLDRLDVRVRVRHDLDAIAGGQVVITDHAASFDRVSSLDHLDLVVLTRLGDDDSRRQRVVRIRSARALACAARGQAECAEYHPKAGQPVQE